MTATPTPWLFSRRTDLLVFSGIAIAALALLLAAPSDGSIPLWLWLTTMIGTDVAHVWSTVYVTYLDPVARRRILAWLLLTPPLCYLAGLALYALGEASFWRVIAYAATFHFVRQQYGWMMMYRARAGLGRGLGRAIDAAAIYAATLVPLVYWHTHLPRRFWWMRERDYVTGLPSWLWPLALGCYVIVGLAYTVMAWRQRRATPTLWGKHLLLASTAMLWMTGLVLTNSDYAFTVTNVFAHGLPYMVLVIRLAAARRATSHAPLIRPTSPWRYVLACLIGVWLLAYGEELLWDQLAWHEYPQLFGTWWRETLAPHIAWLAPLLIVPQATHYVLDGVIWRRTASTR